MERPLKLVRRLTPVLASCAAIFAFYAGHYIGTHNQANVHEGEERYRESIDSASRLWVASTAIAFLGEGKTSDALSVLDGEVQLQATVVLLCLDRADCAGRLGSPESQAQLRRIAEAHLPASAPAKHLQPSPSVEGTGLRPAPYVGR